MQLALAETSRQARRAQDCAAPAPGAGRPRSGAPPDVPRTAPAYRRGPESEGGTMADTTAPRTGADPAPSTTDTPPDAALKARHRAMWASGDYASMVETFLLPLGPRLVEACRIVPGMHVLDVGAGSGNASIPAAQRGASVTASDLTPALLDAGRELAEGAGVDLGWVEADAERLPFDDASFDVVMSSIGVMFAPHHQAAADELVRVCRPGGTVGLLSWTPEGLVGGLFRTIGPFAPAPPPGAQPPPLWGSEAHLEELFGERVAQRTVQRDVLEVTAFAEPGDFADHFRARYGPAIAARANAAKSDREGDFDAALDRFFAESNGGTEDHARFDVEYLLTVGTRV